MYAQRQLHYSGPQGSTFRRTLPKARLSPLKIKHTADFGFAIFQTGQLEAPKSGLAPRMRSHRLRWLYLQQNRQMQASEFLFQPSAFSLQLPRRDSWAEGLFEEERRATKKRQAELSWIGLS